MAFAALVAMGAPARAADAPASQQDAMPQRERDLIAILAAARKQYMAGPSATAAQNIRTGMQIDILAFMRKNSVAQDWVGTVKSQGITPESDGWISLEIADGITISTWKDEKEDSTAFTLFKPHSALLQASQSAKLGQRVTFSATFLRSLLASDDQMISQPEFIARFSALKVAP
jgi:hypothetical protein